MSRVTLVCAECGGVGEFDSSVTVKGVPISDWFRSIGSRCTACRAKPASENHVGRFHSGGHDTEAAAAQAIKPVSGRQRLVVLDALKRAGQDGLTDYECGRDNAMFRHVAGTRREELMKMGYAICKTDLRRPTDTGRQAIVWVLET